MGTPDWVRRVNVSTSDGLIDYVVADDEATIVWLANLAALEMHVPQWTVGSATPVDNIISLPELDRVLESRWPTAWWSTWILEPA